MVFTSVLIPLKSGKFLNIRERQKRLRIYVLIPLKSGKFLNYEDKLRQWLTFGLNPFEVREVSKRVRDTDLW